MVFFFSFHFCIYQAMEKLKSFREKVKGKQQFLAMYSSIFGGITTDPAAMDQEISTYLPLAAIQSCLYAIAIRDPSPINFMGVKVVTSNVPIKPQFATTKSVNYLPNVGAFVAIWFDSDGFVAEGPSMNVAFVSKENEFVMPLRDNILSGCTAKRVLTLAESLVKEGKLCGIRMKNVNVEEGKKCR
ncbi:D-amino-acid transaminase, chloroplastic [Glycine max]|nr:D-amino-acid transaminase, chloroplastic [Glycine max]